MFETAYIKRQILVTACLFALLLPAFGFAAVGSFTPEQVKELARKSERMRLEGEGALIGVKQVRQELIDRLLETQEILLTLEQKAVVHFNKMSALLHNEQGRILAQDPNLLAFYTYLQLKEKPVVTLYEIREKQLLLLSLQRKVLLGQDGPEVGYLPDQETRDQVTILFHWAKNCQEDFDGQVAALNQLIRWEPTEELDTSQGLTLDQKMEERKGRWDRIVGIIRPMAEEEVRPEVKKLLFEVYKDIEFEKGKLEGDITKAHEELSLARKRQGHEIVMQDQTFLLEKTRRLADEDLKRRQDDLDSQGRELQALRALHKAMVDNKLNILETRTARQQLIAKAESPDVQFLLRPFITPGHWQPNRSRTGFKKSGISLTHIRQKKCLMPTPNGLKQLLLLGRNSANKERYPWEFPKDVPRLTPDQRDQLERAQQYLIELGPTLVNLGYLAK